MKKTKTGMCPKCGGPAGMYPVITEPDPIDPNYYYETLECVYCGALWEETCERVYWGYKYKGQCYNADGEPLMKALIDKVRG